LEHNKLNASVILTLNRVNKATWRQQKDTCNS